MATMVPGVLKRMQSKSHEDLPTVEKTVKTGKFTIKNVPFTQRKNGELGPDGKSEYLSSDVMYQLSGMFEIMMKTDYDEPIDYKEGYKLFNK
ncbi:hypothetical protein O0Q50_32030 [Priestia aryabhattai]|uniref:Uncharacterized protein n=1 Tax=Priestia aryabhattai TaxID=412384 RepID=A0AAX6NJ16_PRIAR|nr:hypothetical protein [Priestia aryabhattai]MDU9695797.1 hypothetical protein [Priestia aryabhattai]